MGIIITIEGVGNRKLEIVRIGDFSFSTEQFDAYETLSGFACFADLPSLRCFQVECDCFRSFSHVTFQSGSLSRG